MTSRILGFGAIVLIAAALVAVPARASSLLQRELDFPGMTGGSLKYVIGVGNSLSITGALIHSVEAFPSFVSLPITSGGLNFTTAGCATGCKATVIKGGVQSTPFFNYGGSLTIVGELAGMLSPQVLLMGSFSPSGLFGSPQPSATLNSATKSGGFNGGLYISQINPLLYNAFLPLIFKVPSSSGKGYISEMFINLSFVGVGPITGSHQFSNGTWSGTVRSSDLSVKPVPEPSSLLLVGTMFLVAAGLLRRKVPKLAA